MYVRKNHPYDGSVMAGRPTGPVLQVVGFRQHEPVDGPGAGIIYELSDGSWAFPWNVTPEKGGKDEHHVDKFRQQRECPQALDS